MSRWDNVQSGQRGQTSAQAAPETLLGDLADLQVGRANEGLADAQSRRPGLRLGAFPGTLDTERAGFEPATQLLTTYAISSRAP